MKNQEFPMEPWSIKQYKHHMNRKSYVVRNTHTITTESGLREICKVSTGLNAERNLYLIKAAPKMLNILMDLELWFRKNADALSDKNKIKMIANADDIANVMREARGDDV